MGAAAGENDVDHLGAVAQGFGHGCRVEHAVVDGVVDFVEDHQVPIAGFDGRTGFGPGFLDHADVFGIGFCAAYFYEAAAHLLEYEIVTKGLYGIQFAVTPRAFEELEHENAHAVSDGAQSGAERGGGFALAGSGVDEDEAFSGIGHSRPAYSSRFAVDTELD